VTGTGPSDRITPPPGTIPPAEVDIDAELVVTLIAEQHPDLADLPVSLASHGWDNDTYRLGRDLAVRLPRRATAVPLLGHEQRWLPVLAPYLPVAVPEPVHVGRPGAGYPWPWSIVPWIPGVRAELEPVDPSRADRLGEVLAALHAVPVAADPPSNPVRGVPLGQRHDSVTDRIARIRAAGHGSPQLDGAERTFAAGEATAPDGRVGWLHGDPHPRNVITREGRLVGLIDWGDVCVGDQATDLAAPWMHLPIEAHEAFWSAYGAISEATRRRARGWAAFFAVVLLDVGIDNDAGFARIGRRTLDRLAD